MDRYLVSQFELENPFPKIDISCYLEIFDKKNEYYITIVENGDCDRYILFLSLNLRKTRSYVKIFGLDVIW